MFFRTFILWLMTSTKILPFLSNLQILVKSRVRVMDMSDAIIVNSSRLKSVVWNDFDRVKKGEIFLAICRHCKKKLSGSSKSGTSHLRNHLKRCQRRSNHGISAYLPLREKKKGRSLSLVTVSHEQKKDDVFNVASLRNEQEKIKNEIVNGGNGNIDQTRSQFDLARMIILHGYSLSIVDHVGFKVFVNNLQPMFELVTFSKVESNCLDIYEKEKKKVSEVLDKLPGKISISVDAWNTSEDAEYLCLTAHYIDEDWQLRRKILNLIWIEPSYTEVKHSEEIIQCLMDWDIDRKLFSMVSDSSTNETIVEIIKNRLLQSSLLHCNGQSFDIRCVVNLLNNMVEDIIGAFSEVFQKIRHSIRHVKSSQEIQAMFSRLAQELQVQSEKCLFIDNPFRWNSTYFMLEVAVEYREPFSQLRERDPDNMIFLPSDLDWDRMSTITGFLKHFIEVMNIFTRNKFPTANIFFAEVCHLHVQLIEWCTSPDDYVNSLATKMRNKFEDYWNKCSLGLALAAMLDPRFKLKLLEYYYPKIYGDSASGRINEVRNCIYAFYHEHSRAFPLAVADQGLGWEGSSGAGSMSSVSGKDSRDRLMGFDKFLNETCQSQSSKSDYDQYLEDALFPRGDDLDVLNWWKVHTPRYPILSMMARNILGIPVSKVAFESAFNTGGKVIDSNWSSLRPTTVQALMCSQDWIRGELES